MIAVERAGLELVRDGRSAVEAEPGRTVNRATIAKLDKSHMSYGSVDFGQIAPMVGESELLGTIHILRNCIEGEEGGQICSNVQKMPIGVRKCLKVSENV